MPAADQLIAALERIRALEERPDYMGPKISREIDEARHALELADGLIEYVCDEYGHRATVSIPDEWLEDVVVGVVCRGCNRNGWRSFSSGPWWGDECDMYRFHVNDDRSNLITIQDGVSRALAALLAWGEAITTGKR